jgi:ABC-type uncharacterized transport system permease subunit
VLCRLETLYLVTALGLYVALPYSAPQQLNAAAKGALVGGLLATTQVPLDWDFESTWQVYPIPILLAMDWGHSTGLILGALKAA